MTDLTPRQELEGRAASALAAHTSLPFREAIARLRTMEGKVVGDYEDFLRWYIDVHHATPLESDAA
jgi:hypothetical protein